MNWEDLKVYTPLKKERLKTAYKDLTKIIADNLSADGFKLKGRKLIKQSNDLFHIIHLDTRGSWMGTSDGFKTEISICSIYDADTFILNYELTASKKIEDLIAKIRNYYRITQEYPLLADFLTRKIRESILPYFSQYKSSRDVLNNLTKFKLDNITEITERNANLILYCELANKAALKSSEILIDRLTKYRKIKLDDKIVKHTEFLLSLINGKLLKKCLTTTKDKYLKNLKLKYCEIKQTA
ncbi:hypothetical protein EZ456_02610 [Pedobacter psychrodurus]|uniref:Uncharacterized protein n=1 Tax=Pedobacter psychrodurus TaxID=2530456 RepID=A0A4R0Q091_9SPHI|nr:hypothetical protein [Pedobacter psychrodurus]TCD29071.1 hypothetical protein EZ456_02610 [Pedobacter psychrodurus]